MGSVSDSINSAKNSLNDQFNASKSNLSDNWNQARDIPSNTLNGVKNDISNQWNEATANPFKYATNPNTANQINGVNTLRNSYNSIERPVAQGFQGLKNGLGQGFGLNGVTPSQIGSGFQGQMAAALNSTPTATSVQGR